MTKGLTVAAHEVKNFATSDERLNEDGWEMALIGGVHRDSEALDRSNARVLLARLAAVDPDNEGHDVMRARHWAVGWYDQLIVCPENEAVMGVLRAAKESLEDYPILDENDWADLELEDHENDACNSSECSHCEMTR